MTKGANKAGREVCQAAPKPKVVATIGLVTCGPITTTGYSSKARKLGDGSRGQEQSYERVTKMNNELDKKSGSYERFTTKEKVSSGQVYSGGQVGVKKELKNSSTFKVGNKRGYTEYYTEERVRDVSFNNGNGNGSSYNNNRLTYDDGHSYNDNANGYDYDYDYDY